MIYTKAMANRQRQIPRYIKREIEEKGGREERRYRMKEGRKRKKTDTHTDRDGDTDRDRARDRTKRTVFYCTRIAQAHIISVSLHHLTLLSFNIRNV